eukprot:gene17054-8570_t
MATASQSGMNERECSHLMLVYNAFYPQPFTLNEDKLIELASSDIKEPLDSDNAIVISDYDLDCCNVIDSHNMVIHPTANILSIDTTPNISNIENPEAKSAKVEEQEGAASYKLMVAPRFEINKDMEFLFTDDQNREIERIKADRTTLHNRVTGKQRKKARENKKKHGQEHIGPQCTSESWGNSGRKPGRIKINMGKYERGHLGESSGYWAGTRQRQRKFLCCFLLPVPARDQATLLPIIQQWVEPNTTIWTDMSAEYPNLPQLGFALGTVNHTLNFVASNRGNMNRVEEMWQRAKAKFKAMYGPTNREMVEEYLSEFIWSHQFSDNQFLNLFP